jgi:hypothetical protein
MNHRLLFEFVQMLWDINLSLTGWLGWGQWEAALTLCFLLFLIL